MGCGYYGWRRVIWKWGWEWGYSLLDCAICCEYDAIATGIELPRSWGYLGGIGIWMWLLDWESRDRQFYGRIGAFVVTVRYSDLILIGMGMRCGWFGMRNGVDFTRCGGNDHYFQFPRFWLDFHHFRCGSSLFPCSHSDNAQMRLNELWGGWEVIVFGTNRAVTCLSVFSWRSIEELRCLFVREGWSEYFLWLWRHPCTRMLYNRDTHRWDWACLNIIHSGWELLSRVMWRG